MSYGVVLMEFYLDKKEWKKEMRETNGERWFLERLLCECVIWFEIWEGKLNGDFFLGG